MISHIDALFVSNLDTTRGDIDIPMDTSNPFPCVKSSGFSGLAKSTHHDVREHLEGEHIGWVGDRTFSGPHLNKENTKYKRGTDRGSYILTYNDKLHYIIFVLELSIVTNQELVYS